jgi:hypothetical protein
MGMPTAFTDKADFSGIDPKRGVAISAVVHKAFVDVSEQGTEAAAATGITMRPTAMPMPEQAVVFRADHPFIFLIRDTRTEVVLFIRPPDDAAVTARNAGDVTYLSLPILFTPFPVAGAHRPVCGDILDHVLRSVFAGDGEQSEGEAEQGDAAIVLSDHAHIRDIQAR